MTTRQRRFDDAIDSHDFEGRRNPTALAGSLVLAAALGIGIGLLAAPQAGVKTRRQLRRRLAALGEDLGEGLDDARARSGRARERVRDGVARLRERAEEELDDLADRFDGDAEDESESSTLGTLLAVAAGVATTYFLTSERTAPARERVKEAAATMRERAVEQLDRYHRAAGPNGQPARGASPVDEGVGEK